jgi:hypothetical protein
MIQVSREAAARAASPSGQRRSWVSGGGDQRDAEIQIASRARRAQEQRFGSPGQDELHPTWDPLGERLEEGIERRRTMDLHG